jgi:23S rRNA pseudouridine1911/1915/1917 synthase
VSAGPAQLVEVPEEAAGTRLDRFLADLEDIGSRAAAERLVEAGAVLVDGQATAKSFRLQGGEQLRIEPQESGAGALEPVDLGLVIPFEDEHLLVVEKPAGLVTHPAPGVRPPTLVHALLGHRIAGGEDPERPGIVHRLDRDTSGLLVVAKEAAAHRRLQQLLRDRVIERRYRALVHGRPPSRRGTIEAPIGRDPLDPARMAVDGRAARAAVTHFTLDDSLGRHSLLDVKLDTGRTHQIRVHLAAIGHPVVGDPLYGRGGAELGLDRQFLHAAELAFPHPVTDEPLRFASPLPADLQAALERAEMRAGPPEVGEGRAGPHRV